MPNLVISFLYTDGDDGDQLHVTKNMFVRDLHKADRVCGDDGVVSNFPSAGFRDVDLLLDSTKRQFLKFFPQEKADS